MSNSDSRGGILWLKISPASREQLKAAYPPRYESMHYDHVTLLFDISRENVRQYIGRQEQVEVYAHCFNDRVEAVRVQSDLPDTYGVPHITLSVQPGVSAFESVAMLRGDHTEITREAILPVMGTIEFVPFS